MRVEEILFGYLQEGLFKREIDGKRIDFIHKILKFGGIELDEMRTQFRILFNVPSLLDFSLEAFRVKQHLKYVENKAPRFLRKQGKKKKNICRKKSSF